jgi:DNA replication protein DnaC
MDETMKTMLKALRLSGLLERWDEYVKLSEKRDLSSVRWLTRILEEEYRDRQERSRQCRLNRACIPEVYTMATYPFARQPKLDKKRLLAVYDSFVYMEKRENVLLLGRTGCGKTGLATAFLVQAIERGYSGRFISFSDLIAELYASVGDHTQRKVLRKYADYDCLVVDEVGYIEVEPVQAGLFFTLMQKRHKQRTTLITSNLGLDDWRGFLKNEHLTLALNDRLTETSHVFNLKDCKTLRDALGGGA